MGKTHVVLLCVLVCAAPVWAAPKTKTVPSLANAVPAKAAPDIATLSVGNPTRGASTYTQRCGGCHSLEVNRIGPAHRGIIGRKSGQVAGFAYSPALKAANITFTEATLERWLSNPQTTVPGTKMFFRLNTPAERADVIAYLKTQTSPR